MIIGTPSITLADSVLSASDSLTRQADAIQLRVQRFLAAVQAA